MKKITFLQLTIKNFLSIGSEPVIIKFDRGVNFLTGKNLDVPGTNNGCGKSSVISAFNFAIFGEAVKKLNKDQLINNITGQTAEVILEFNCDSPRGNNTFIIKRTVGPSSCTVTKDGRDKSRDSIPNTNRYILEVLSASPEIFKNCVIMSANGTVSFLNQGKVEKKKFIESLFALDIITKMARAVKDDVNLNKSNTAIETKALSIHNETLIQFTKKADEQEKRADNLRQSYQRQEEALAKRKGGVQKNLSEVRRTIVENNGEQIKVKLLEIEKDIAQGKKIDARLAKAALSINLRIPAINKSLYEISERGGKCTKCGHVFTKDDQIQAEQTKKELEQEKSELERKLSKTEEVQTQVLERMEGLVADRTEWRNKETDLKYAIRDENTYIQQLESIEKEERELSQSKTSAEQLVETVDYSKMIAEVETKISNTQSKIDDYKKEMVKLDVATFVLSDTGVKAYIIKKLLDLLNFRVKYYLVKQNSQYQLSFNEYFEEAILNKKQIPVAYQNLSGAESKMLDLACIWAFRDILKLHNQVTYNVAFYDELLDSSMDAHNSAIVCNLLNEAALHENQSIYLVTHKSELTKGFSGNVVYLEKYKGITTMSTL